MFQLDGINGSPILLQVLVATDFPSEASERLTGTSQVMFSFVAM